MHDAAAPWSPRSCCGIGLEVYWQRWRQLRSTIIETRPIAYRFYSTARTPVPDGNDKDSLKVISKPRDEQKLAVRELARISQKRLLGSHAPY